MNSIDLNCDMGESFGAWKMGADAEVMPHISSANIACGFHAGDPLTMQATLDLAIQYGVAIGAHPSLPDLQGFGRREMKISAYEVHALIVYQVGALAAFAQARGVRLAHVKPHGALYNMAARDTALADAIASAIQSLDANLILVGLAGSELPRAGERHGLSVAHEAFADRRYRADGSLAPRNLPGAVIADEKLALEQALAIAQGRPIATLDASELIVRADSICVHGDHAHAALFARRLRETFAGNGITVAAMSDKR
jgi:UPF0271 protein